LVTHNRILAFLALLLFQIAAANDIPKADKVLVDKSEKRLYLIKDGERFMSLPVTFGGEPKGHKVQQGDQRTPEGHYTLEWKNSNSKFYKSIRVSYPNAEDRAKAERLGVDPGGDIMVHGQANGWQWASPLLQFFSWTDGCVALSNKNMDKVWESVEPGTPIEIRP
jgi:murein L,D-transpeptidase YafK